MARRKIGYEELMQRKGTYAVKAALAANMARFEKREAKAKAELETITKARAEHQADFDKVINAVNAAAVAALTVPPKKVKTDVADALAETAPVPAATETPTDEPAASPATEATVDAVVEAPAPTTAAV